MNNIEQEVVTVAEKPVKLFDRIFAEAREGVTAAFEHIMHVTESELSKTRSYFEGELATLRAELAKAKSDLEAELAKKANL